MQSKEQVIPEVRLLSSDVLSMERQYETTYTRDKKGRLVVNERAVILHNDRNLALKSYFQPLPGPAQSRKNDFSKLANQDFGEVFIAKDYQYFIPIMVRFMTSYVDGRAGYGFVIPESTFFDTANTIVWIPKVTVNE